MNIQTRTPISRRTVARTAAWAVPVVSIAVAAPAFATSGGGCTDKGSATMVADSSGIVRNLDLVPHGAVATVTITQIRHKKSVDPFSDAETGRIFTTDYGTPWSYVRLHHAQGMQHGDVLTMTITFTQPVKGFGFTVTDIDGATGSWIDQVALSPGFSLVSSGHNVVGDGTSATPFQSDVQGNIDSADGDVTVVWPGALTSFTVTYTAADTKNDSAIGQMVGIGKFTYDNCL